MNAELLSDIDFIDYDCGSISGVGTLYVLDNRPQVEETIVDKDGSPITPKIKIGFY